MSHVTPFFDIGGGLRDCILQGSSLYGNGYVFRRNKYLHTLTSGEMDKVKCIYCLRPVPIEDVNYDKTYYIKRHGKIENNKWGGWKPLATFHYGQCILVLTKGEEVKGVKECVYEELPPFSDKELKDYISNIL